MYSFLYNIYWLRAFRERKLMYKLRNDLIRRHEAIVKYYKKTIGQAIKKARGNLDMTQESLANGICSNTYISKIENNQIEANRENLLLIMEKMNMAPESIVFPEDMVGYLEDSLLYFFYKEKERYAALFKEVEKYEVAVLIQICKLGYHVLMEEYDKAEPINDEIYQYLDSLEDFGLNSFLLFSCFYNIGIGNFKTAKAIIDRIDVKHHTSGLKSGLYHYANFLIYGNIYRFNKSRESLYHCQHIFFSNEARSRYDDLSAWKSIFSIYEGEESKTHFDRYDYANFCSKERNYFLLVNLLKSDEQEKILQYFDKNQWYYQAGCFIVAKKFLSRDNRNKYEFYLNEIKESSPRNFEDNPIDFANLLTLFENGSRMQYKDYLANVCLPYANKIQNLFFMNCLTYEISEILAENKRYKDSLTYIRKNMQKVQSIQEHTL